MVDQNNVHDYCSVTEAPGVRITQEASSMLYTRYRHAANFALGKDVLEIGCGTGMGLGYMAQYARKVIGGDFSETLLNKGHAYYGSRIPFLRLDAHKLPFRDNSFDVVVIFEAIYYFSQPNEVVMECWRVLRDEGILLICSANIEWEGFHPSPHSHTYFSSKDLRELLESVGYQVEILAGFPPKSGTLFDSFVSRVRKIAVKMSLIPKTMVSKESLKRLFYGRLVQVPWEIVDGFAELKPLVPVTNGASIDSYKVLYAVAHRGHSPR